MKLGGLVRYNSLLSVLSYESIGLTIIGLNSGYRGRSRDLVSSSEGVVDLVEPAQSEIIVYKYVIESGIQKEGYVIALLCRPVSEVNKTATMSGQVEKYDVPLNFPSGIVSLA